MKNFFILIFVVLVFIGIAKMTQSPETANNAGVKSVFSKVSAGDKAPAPAETSAQPVQNKPAPAQKVDDSSVKAQLNALSMQILAHAENHDNAGMQVYVQKMAELGVTEMCQPQVFQKQTPTCPPVKISVNGTVKSGSLCALTCYKYKGQEYEVGYCK